MNCNEALDLLLNFPEAVLRSRCRSSKNLFRSTFQSTTPKSFNSNWIRMIYIKRQKIVNVNS